MPTSLPYPSGNSSAGSARWGTRTRRRLRGARGGCTGRCSTTPSPTTGPGRGSASSTSAAGSAGCCASSRPRPRRPSSTAATSTAPASSGCSRTSRRPFHVFESSEEAGLPQEDGFFDLIYAFSVYTHFTDNWAEWLLEHHRVLADGGILFATFLGEGMLEPLTGEKWDEDRIGMNPLLHGFPWDKGGPLAFNSPWWIRAHWGRAFEIVQLDAPDRARRRQPRDRRRAQEAGSGQRRGPEGARARRAARDRARCATTSTSSPRSASSCAAPTRPTSTATTPPSRRCGASFSWRLTSPLRRAKGRLRGG